MEPISQPSVLVVDDEYSIRSSIAEMIEMFGFFSENAANAQEALEYLQKNPQTDIVLLDIDLGVGLSGIDLLPIIREKYKYVQVMMFTSQNSLEMGVECLKKGAVDYLTKPFREKEFLKKAPIALERKKLAQLNGNLEKNLMKALFVGKITIVGSKPMIVTAGMAKMPLLKFYCVTVPCTLVLFLLCMGIGYFLGNQWIF